MMLGEMVLKGGGRAKEEGRIGAGGWRRQQAAKYVCGCVCTCVCMCDQHEVWLVATQGGKPHTLTHTHSAMPPCPQTLCGHYQLAAPLVPVGVNHSPPSEPHRV